MTRGRYNDTRYLPTSFCVPKLSEEKKHVRVDDMNTIHKKLTANGNF